MPSRHRRLTPGLAAVLAVLALLAPLACSSSKKADPTSTTTAQQAKEAVWRKQLKQLAGDWYRALADSGADPAQPADLAKYAVDPELSAWKRNIAELQARHEAVRPAPDPKARLWVLDVTLHPSSKGATAIVRTCEIDDRWVVDTRTGKPVDTSVTTYETSLGAVLNHSGAWRFATARHTETAGVSGCAANH